MSENMLFCFGEGKYESKGVGYQKNYHIFNKPVTKEVFEKLDTPEFSLDLISHNTFKAAFIAAWSEIDQTEKDKVLNLPNFDAELFKERCGIDITQTRTVDDILAELSEEDKEILKSKLT